MSMLVPTRSNRSLFDTLMTDPFEAFFDTPTRTTTSSLMRTDIRETADGFELVVELPGFKKENVTAELKDGYLSISAKTHSESEDKEEKGTWLRKERFSGTCNRSFYVGEDIAEEDIHAKFEDGLLKITVPKKQPQPKLEEKRTIAIEG
ncbi:MAG: Hsp20/alpha crystallin family protein [Eggerthellaceae bacterium]|nr:Hsp20/alpha crystallin family protein [Eggerthellaceae bacterium]